MPDPADEPPQERHVDLTMVNTNLFSTCRTMFLPIFDSRLGPTCHRRYLRDTHERVFSSSKLDYSECSLRPFEIKLPPGTHPMQPRPYRLSLVSFKQADAILNPYITAGLIQHSTSSWWNPLECVLLKAVGFRIIISYHRKTLDCNPPAPVRFSWNHPPGCCPLGWPLHPRLTLIRFDTNLS